jgi:hypothetical protein
MKRAVIVLAAWALILSGCGQTKDPFVGTWQAVGFSPGNGYTISKVSGAYRITTVAHFKPLPGYSFPCSRRGDDELIIDPGKTPYVEAVKVNPAGGRLTATSNGMDPQVLTKVSDSTAPPTPWPSASP